MDVVYDGPGASVDSTPRRVARDWSRAIYRTYPDLDDLVWSSGPLAPGRCIALYETHGRTS